MANQWFKFYGGEYLGDPKVYGMTAQERSCWVTLLCLASISSSPGKISFLSEEQLMLMSGIDFQKDEWDSVRGVLKKFENLKMIDVSDGYIQLINYEKRQNSNLTEAEKKAKYREKKKKDVVQD